MCLTDPTSAPFPHLSQSGLNIILHVSQTNTHIYVAVSKILEIKKSHHLVWDFYIILKSVHNRFEVTVLPDYNIEEKETLKIFIKVPPFEVLNLSNKSSSQKFRLITTNLSINSVLLNLYYYENVLSLNFHSKARIS